MDNAADDAARRARSARFATMPIVLAGTIAVTAGLTGPVVVVVVGLTPVPGLEAGLAPGFVPRPFVLPARVPVAGFVPLPLS